MKYYICPKLDCDCNLKGKCKHSMNHLRDDNCRNSFHLCPPCVEVEDFIIEDEMEIE